jgi:hypothetical protein
MAAVPPNTQDERPPRRSCTGFNGHVMGLPVEVLGVRPFANGPNSDLEDGFVLSPLPGPLHVSGFTLDLTRRLQICHYKEFNGRIVTMAYSYGTQIGPKMAWTEDEFDIKTSDLYAQYLEYMIEKDFL